MKLERCDYPCTDTNRDFITPDFRGDRSTIRIVMVSEAPSVDHSDYFYRDERGAFFLTTRTAFGDAGCAISSYDDLTRMGVYLTTAIKCSKSDYRVSAGTIDECSSRYLARELSSFAGVRVIMCMGDFAIRAVNRIYRNAYGVTPIPKGPTYKIRNATHEYNGIVFIPSYTQTGDSFNIEQSKRKMIAEDIGKALEIIR
mgnify:FL=1